MQNQSRRAQQTSTVWSEIVHCSMCAQSYQQRHAAHGRHSDRNAGLVTFVIKGAPPITIERYMWGTRTQSSLIIFSRCNTGRRVTGIQKQRTACHITLKCEGKGVRHQNTHTPKLLQKHTIEGPVRHRQAHQRLSSPSGQCKW